MRVKLCGIASDDDARAAASARPDFAGFLVGLDYSSEDGVSAEEARRLSGLLPGSVSPVLVTHRTSVEAVAGLAVATGFRTIQLHGEFPPEWIPDLRARLPGAVVWRVVHVEDRTAIARSGGIARLVDAVVLDTRTADRVGGTGHVHDWVTSAEVARTCGKPVILAGGLTPENVAEAVRIVGPWAVDVNSGVEDGAGRKDPARARRFVEIARGDIPR